MSFDVNGLTTIPQEQFPSVLRRCTYKYVPIPFLGTEKLYGQLDLGDATYSFDGVRADAEAAHLRKGVIGAKRARRHSGGGDALAVHPIKEEEEEDEITANDDDGGVNSNNGTMLETAALIQRRRRQRQRQRRQRRGRRQKAKADGDRGEGGIYVANRSPADLVFDASK